MKKPKAVILARVSTDKQKNSRQIEELTTAASLYGWDVVEVIEECISGATVLEKRPDLVRVLDLAVAGKIQHVMVSEVSRLARVNSILHSFIEALEILKVSVYVHSMRISSLLPDGRKNPAAGMMFAIMAEMARAEHQNIRDITRSGLESARARGVRLGTPKLGRRGMLEKHKDAVAMLMQRPRPPMVEIRAATGLSGGTLTTINNLVKSFPGLVKELLSGQSLCSKKPSRK